MNNFTYFTPTKVFFGKDEHKNIGEIIRGYGFKKIMMQYGLGSIKKSGLYDEVMKSLENSGIEVVTMGGVQPNPKLSFVYDAIKLARETNVEMILAVGGGSAIDSSKFTAAGVKYDGDVWDFPSGKSTPKEALPVGCILTISAAGSEMSSSAVISNEELNMKRGFNSDVNRCLFAVCNPELSYSVSPYQTACGIVDMMSHTIERYFTTFDPTDLTDSLAEGLLKSIIKAGKAAIKNPSDYNARATLMWASSLAHNGLTGCGRANALAVHQLEHALSGEYQEIAHGAGLAVLIPAWARYVYKENPSRFAQFARNVWDVSEQDDMKASLLGIEKMEEFFTEIGMPQKLREFNIPSDCSKRLAELCTFGKTRTIGSQITLDFDHIKNIFDLCY